MYKHYESSEDVFVDREEYIEWMLDALEQCKDKVVVLHLKGIGGIGKSSLLDYWRKTVENNIPLDCQQYTDFYDRLNVLAKGAALVGIQLKRFDVLWQIRQRFVVSGRRRLPWPFPSLDLLLALAALSMQLDLKSLLN